MRDLDGIDFTPGGDVLRRPRDEHGSRSGPGTARKARVNFLVSYRSLAKSRFAAQRIDLASVFTQVEREIHTLRWSLPQRCRVFSLRPEKNGSRARADTTAVPQLLAS